VKFLIWVLVNALALAAAAWLLDGITITGSSDTDRLITLILVALIFGVVNAVVGTVVKIISIPFIILTLGLLIFVINALMLMLTGWISEQLDLNFHVDGFWTALWGAIIVSVTSWLLGVVLPDRD
jgi:putative membrane protein